MIQIAMLGYWCPEHALEFANGIKGLPHARVCCVWDSLPERSAAFSKKLGVRGYTDLQALYRDEKVDAVILNAEPWAHASIAAEAAGRGKHVLADKIVAMGAPQRARLRRAVSDSKVCFATCFALFRRPFYQTAAAAIREGLLGRVVSLHMREACNKFSAPGAEGFTRRLAADRRGVLCDMGFHMLYLAPFLLGEQPAAVSATASRVMGYNAEDNASYTLRFPSGAYAVHEVSYLSEQSPFEFAVYGDKGTLYMGGPVVKALPPGAPLPKHWGRCLLGTGGQWRQLEPVPPLACAEVDFVEAIAAGRPPMFGLEDGLEKSIMLDAVFAAADTGTAVDMTYDDSSLAT